MYYLAYTPDEMIATATGWVVGPKGIFVELGRLPRYPYVAKRPVSEEELASVLPQLPEALREIHRSNNTPLSAVGVQAEWVRCLVAHFQHPLQLVTSSGVPFWVYQVKSAVEHPGGKFVTLSTFAYTVKDTAPYVDQVYHPHIKVATAWLEQEYPGWLARLRMLDALDITDATALRRWLFMKSDMAQTLPLTGVSFE